MVSRFNSAPIEGLKTIKIKPDVSPVSGVAEALQNGALLLTSTARQAADWKRRLVTASGAGVVATPIVESWQQWLAKLAREHADIPVPLTSLQELQLWERIIAADMAAVHNDASARGLARHAARAYVLLQDYRIDTSELAGAGEEAEALGRWIAAMRRTLKQMHRMLVADLPAMLLPLLDSAAKVPQLLLDGFERFTPMQQSVLQRLQENDVLLASVVSGNDPAAVTVTSCADAECEYRHVARRVAAAIEADAQARIAVVTSRQVSDTETLRRILDETLLPRAQVNSSMQAANMAGRPLAAAPLIRQLLALLQMAGKGGAAYADLSPLLFSPGIKGYARERWERAQLDARLRKDNRHYLSFESLRTTAEASAMPQLAEVVGQLLDWESGMRSAGEWVKAVHALLQATGFLQAEAAERSNGEIRQLNAFRECLASLVAVDAVDERMAWGAFLTLLVSVCNETPLSDPVRYPQVDVLPLEQITGLEFDTLFAVGFDEEALPLPVLPVPLLPFALQRRHGLPGSTAALAFAESGFLWQQLRQAAPVVHASFARSRQERELNPSPLLAGLEAGICDAALLRHEASETEPFEDAPPVPLAAAERVQGGAAIIRNQSLCPFRAFAAHRLGLAPLGETTPGVTPADKGSLIHQALQYIWERLRSQNALLALDDEAAAVLLDEAVAHAWGEAHVAAAGTVREFERRRMTAVLAAWLEQERQRPPFRVERCEKAYRLELPAAGALRFPVNLKADRIDRDAEGHRILIDYKTGRKQSPGKWIGERMPEPQLPLYAVAEELGAEDAVCFARVRSGDMGFEGLAGEATGIKGIAVYKGSDEEAEDWAALLACWRERIDALATEFVVGRCEVAPQDAHACDYCGLEAVCRIDEIGIDRDEEGEA